MDSPTYVVVINDHHLYEFKLDRTEAIKDAIYRFTEYNEAFEKDYRNSSEEEKKNYAHDIEAYLATAGDINTIRVFEK